MKRKIIYSDSIEMIVVRDFIEEYWSSFSNKCKNFELNPEEIYKNIGGEEEEP